jgi:hypothetical protein
MWLLFLEVIAVERGSTAKQTIGRGKVPKQFASDWDDDGTVESGAIPSKRSRTSGALNANRKFNLQQKILKMILKNSGIVLFVILCIFKVLVSLRVQERPDITVEVLHYI